MPVLGIDTLLAVAEDARQRCGAARVVAVLAARMNEVYAARQEYSGGAWRRDGDIVLTRPGSLEVPEGWTLAGNAFAAYGAQMPSHVQRMEAAPHASALLRLAPHMIAAGQAHEAAGAMPVYIRDKVAQTTEERAAVRAALPPKS